MDNVAVALRAHASGIKRSPGNMRAKRMPQRRRHRRSHCCRCFALAGIRDGSGAAKTRRSSSCKTTEVTGAMLLSMFKLWTQECNPNSCNQAWARCNRRPSSRETGEVVQRNRSASGVHVSAASSSSAHCARSLVSWGRCFCRKAMAASGAPGVNQCTRQAVFHNASPIRESVLCLRCNDRSCRRTSSKLSSSTCKRLPEPMRSADIPSPLVLSPESLAASLPFLAALRLAHPGCRTRCRHAQALRGGGTAHARATPGMARPTACFLPAGNAVCSKRSGSGRENFQKRGTNWRSSAYPPTSEPMAHESHRSLFSSGRAYSVCPPNRPPSSLCVPRSTTSTVWSEQHRDSWLWSPGFTTALALPFCGTPRGLHEDRPKLSQVCRRWPPLCGGRLTRRDRSAHDALGCTCGTRCSSEGGGVAGGR